MKILGGKWEKLTPGEFFFLNFDRIEMENVLPNRPHDFVIGETLP